MRYSVNGTYRHVCRWASRQIVAPQSRAVRGDDAAPIPRGVAWGSRSVAWRWVELE